MATVDLDNSERSLMQALIRKSLMGQRNDSTRFRLNAINAKLVAPVAPDPGLREVIAEVVNSRLGFDGMDADEWDDITDAVLSVLAERGVR